MRATIQKWGNSLAVRIPGALAKEARVTTGTVAEMIVEKGKIILSPVKDPEYTLEELMKDVTREKMHREVDWNKPIGREVW